MIKTLKNSKNMSNSNDVIETAEKSFSFKLGFSQLTKRQAAEIRKTLMDHFGWSRPTFYYRLNGMAVPKVTEAEAIEVAFKKYGITEIWGNTNES